VLVVAPWNYPFLTSVNAVVPAILAGNSVILKTSQQTPLVAVRYAQPFAEAGLPTVCSSTCMRAMTQLFA
jgi:acyl-CoA reductase-like NAD-dependent aldehyde dehydrogenase